MEFERDINSLEDLPKEMFDLINSEVLRVVQPLYEVDPQTAELDEEYERDYKVAQYLFLNWFRKTFSPKEVLYAGSGSDFLPKTVFGKDKVVHTSMEEYKNDDDKYFPDLGEGLKVVADNNHLPFPDTCFEMVMFFGLCTESVISQLQESRRVLKNGGVVVCDSTISENVDLDMLFPDYEKVLVPSVFQNRGVSETSFVVFRKSCTI